MFLVPDELGDERLVFLFQRNRDVVDVAERFIARIHRFSISGHGLPLFMKHAAEQHFFPIHQEPGFNFGVRSRSGASILIQRFYVEFGAAFAVLAEQQPEVGVIDAGFPGAVPAVQVRALAVKLQDDVPDTLESCDFETQDFDFHGFTLRSDCK